jgi:hypothetical protein
MAARCFHCGDGIIWVAVLRRYRHKHTGSEFCEAAPK